MFLTACSSPFIPIPKKPHKSKTRLEAIRYCTPPLLYLSLVCSSLVTATADLLDLTLQYETITADQLRTYSYSGTFQMTRPRSENRKSLYHDRLELLIA